MKIILLAIAMAFPCFAQTSIPAPQPITQDSIDKQAAATFNDLQAAIVGLAGAAQQTAKNVNLVIADIKLMQAMVVSLNQTRFDAIQTSLTAQQGQLDQQNGDIGTVAAVAQDAKSEAETAENSAAAAATLYDNFKDAFPCAILGLKVTTNDLDQRVLTFQTPTLCTAWATYSSQTGLQASRANFSGIGTVTPAFDPTLRTTFTFLMLPGIPDHGTVQVFTYDQGGTKTVRQLEF